MSERGDVERELEQLRESLARLLARPALVTARHRRREAIEAAERELARLQAMLDVDDAPYDPRTAEIPF